ncbi:MAG: hypothetical protein QOG43_2157 [Actinomycetota bacterium]|jgi:hypothetical protein|nr:hypothetical protein [Actinomycetota bacterium]
MERAEDVAGDVAEHDWFKRLARFGMVARGFLYLVVALLALRVATGDFDQRADKQGALQVVVRQPMGKVLVACLAVGFGGYMLWRLVEAAIGPRDEEDPRKAVLKRLGYVGRACIYGGLLATAVKLLVGADEGSGRENAATDWTGRVLGWPGGRLLVGAVGLVVLGGGLYIGWRGVRQKFADRLKGYEMSPRERRWILRLGTVGNIARMIVFVIIGVLLVMAAAQADPHEAVGIDGALRRLAAGPFGPTLLSVIAGGLAAYGLYSFAEARYRRLPTR